MISAIGDPVFGVTNVRIVGRRGDGSPGHSISPIRPSITCGAKFKSFKPDREPPG
jgi:hypothetical protein